jgi:hypothetical protein
LLTSWSVSTSSKAALVGSGIDGRICQVQGVAVDITFDLEDLVAYWNEATIAARARDGGGGA